MPPRKSFSSLSPKNGKRNTKTNAESSSDVEGTPKTQEGNRKTSMAKTKGSNKVSIQSLSEEIHTPDNNQGSSDRPGNPSVVMPDESRKVDDQSVPKGLEDDNQNAAAKSSSRSVIREQEQPPGFRTRQSLRQKSLSVFNKLQNEAIPKGLEDDDTHNAAASCSSSRSVIREHSLPPGFRTRNSLRQKFPTRLQKEGTSIGIHSLEDGQLVPKGFEDDTHNAANSSSRLVIREQPPGVRTRHSLKQKVHSVSNRLPNESSSVGIHTNEANVSIDKAKVSTDVSTGKAKESIKEEKELGSVGSGIIKNHGSSLSSLASWKAAVKARQSGKANKQSACNSEVVISEAKETTKPKVQSGISRTLSSKLWPTREEHPSVPVENRRNTVMSPEVYNYIMEQKKLIEENERAKRLSQEHMMRNNVVAHIKWKGVNHREVGPVGETCWLCESDVGAGRSEEHEFQNAPEISVLSCGHVFHSECLFTILDEKTIDPVCVLCASFSLY